MKPRTEGFLSEENISHESEQFDYIAELHNYLWRFVRSAFPGVGGNLNNWIDPAIEKLESPRTVDALKYKSAADEAMSYCLETTEDEHAKRLLITALNLGAHSKENDTDTYPLKIYDDAKLVVVKQYDGKGEEISISNILPPSKS